MKKKLTHEQMNNQNWRYKKKTAPVDEFAHKNGPVITKKMKETYVPTATTPVKDFERFIPDKEGYSLPHPLKCSKCTYIATSKSDFNNHWSLEH